MAPIVDYHCACASEVSIPPPPVLESSSASFHPLHELFFCEECDAVRCNRCVSVEVSGYYCPNCLFEVPSASVRAEKNRCVCTRRLYDILSFDATFHDRCARNCFLCPCCRNTLSVVPSDPPEMEDGRSMPVSAVGEPPFFLYCNHCRWDSAEVGITFEKPTGLAGASIYNHPSHSCFNKGIAQLQKFEDSAADSLEFERLKEHFEPFVLRAGAAQSSSVAAGHTSHSHHHVNPITAAASSALARDIPGVAKYTPAQPSRKGKGARDEMPEYKARVEASSGKGSGLGGDGDVEFMRGLETVSEVASLDQRWTSSWATSFKSRYASPLHM